MYPCEECGYQGKDVTELKKHVDNYHPKNIYNTRIKQNLQNINLDDDSDNDWNPNQDDEALLAEESDMYMYIPKKRKLTEPEMPILKKNKCEFVCKDCKKNFSRKDNLTRHQKKSCKL